MKYNHTICAPSKSAGERDLICIAEIYLHPDHEGISVREKLRDVAIGSPYVVTFLIGIGGLHHSIAGSAEIFTAMFLSSEFTVFWQRDLSRLRYSAT